MEGQGRSRKVKEGLGGSFPITGLTFQVRKVMCGGGVVVVACRIIVSAPVPFLFLWTFNFEFGTWNWDPDFGLGFGTGLGLDNIVPTTTRRFLLKLIGLFCFLEVKRKRHNTLI